MKHHYLAKLLFLLLFAGFGFPSGAFAQTGSVSGRVTDDKNEGVPGATVLIEGTTIGSSTNVDGTYSIQNVKAGAQTLIISYVGYNTVRRPVTVVAGQNTEVAASLTENTTQLSEAVVVGYGSQNRRQLTGSVAEVDSKAFENTSLPSFDAGLQGRAAGVQVQQASGVPGAAVRVRIRGQASITASSDPLYVVDGVILNSEDFSSKNYGATSASPLNPLAAINPDDIESVSVLKDAAAASIYGARAANGVILITTKRGKTGGDTRFNFNYSVGIQEPTNKLKLLNGPQYRELYREAFRNDSLAGLNPRIPGNINGIPVTRNFLLNGTTDTDWYDEVFQTGRVQDVSLSASGGNDKTRFFVSGGYNQNESMLQGNTFRRGSLRLNLDNTASERITLGTQTALYFTRNNQVRTSYNGGLGAAQSNALVIFPVRNPNGTFFGTQNSNTGNNPTAQLEDRFSTDNLRAVSAVYFNWKIAKGLELRPQASLDFLDQYERFYYSPVNRYYSNQGLGAVDERHVNFYNALGNVVLTYNADLTENNHVTAVAGSEIQFNTQRDLGFYTVAGAGFTNPVFTQTTATIAYDPRFPVAQRTSPVVGYNSTDFYRYVSFFGRVNYAYKGRYITEVSVRTDGSSRFGANKRFGVFPAISAAWIISDENFLKDVSAISQLKLRASAGINGNSDFRTNFPYLGSYSVTTNAYQGSVGYQRTRIENPDLSWETNRAIDVALDFGLFDNRITGSLAYYNKLGQDVILNQAVQVSGTGLARTYANSDVEIRNQGWEAELTSRNVTGNRFTWTSNLNLSANYNKILSSAGLPPDAFESGPGDARLIEGYPIGTNFLAEYAGVDRETGDPTIRALDGSIIRLNSTTPATAVTSNRRPVGDPFPDLVAGLNNTLTFAGLDLSFLFVGSFGNTIYDDGGKYQNGGRLGSWNQTTRLLDRWQKPGDNAEMPRLTLRPFNPDNNNTTQWLYDGTYVRLRTLQLGYTIPRSITSKIKVERLRVYVSGTNLLLFTKFPGWDPEVVRYADAGDGPGRNNQANISFTAPYLPTPQARTILAGFNLSF